MRIFRMPQRSDEWFLVRAGVATASQYQRILTNGGKVSAQAESYMNGLIAERVLGANLDSEEGAGYMTRGAELEADALGWYEQARGVKVQTVGFLRHDTLPIGASPDGLVGDDGGVEIKCPAAHTHVGYMLKSGDGAAFPHKAQIQGTLWLTGRKWWDFLVYHPQLEPLLIRCERDEKWIEKFDAAIEVFCEQMNLGLDRMRELGHRVLPLYEESKKPKAQPVADFADAPF